MIVVPVIQLMRGSGSAPPVVLDYQVAAGEDDAYEADNGSSFTSTATAAIARANTVAGSRNNAGLRFLGVAVPNGKTITAAYISIKAGSDTNDDINADIYAEAVDDAVSFVTNADVTSRARSTAFVNWAQTGISTSVFTNSPNLITVIQEIVNRAGWASGNDMVILCDGLDAANQRCDIKSFESVSADAAKLHIEYTP
jgi:hypothetical protein